ncbi:hypothetical protein BDK51DRAFT_51180 [Blyttiomyces helicus]|uniref:Uncharacterized protein n=1 Tax=Blyttiomyces helicus TaxID=388810 RepID=A0A4V1ISR2_9FUNG|nr:hypothetical protein BDK51DRAFT_51180 [Blyttiomyces helicus]|eukprot:RKO94447.1 hypothetical protein BDK51DRAFT_51180 [Blyttiomyces helicus]
MKFLELTLAAVLATTSVHAQNVTINWAVAFIGGLPGTYPPTFDSQPSPACLVAVTKSLAAAESACALSDIPRMDLISLGPGVPVPASQYPNLLSNVKTFTAAFCTTACGTALQDYAKAAVAACGTTAIYYSNSTSVFPADIQILIDEQVKLSCSHDPTLNQKDVSSYCPVVLSKSVIQMYESNAYSVSNAMFTDAALRTLYCTPCAAQHAKAYASFVGANYVSGSGAPSAFANESALIESWVSSCPTVVTPAADGVLIATPLSSAASSYGVNTGFALLAGFAAVASML